MSMIIILHLPYIKKNFSLMRFLQIISVTFPPRPWFPWSKSCNFSQSARFYILPASSVYAFRAIKLCQAIEFVSLVATYSWWKVFVSLLRYIFETKETKQTDSKGTKTKDAKDNVSQEKIKARLQVNVYVLIFFFLYLCEFLSHFLR